MLDPRWNTFLVLCETMNYTRAAERLCLTQPAVTHHIHHLEDHYGCRLFTYEGKVLRLTEAGLRLREYTRSLAYNSQKVEEAWRPPRPCPCGWGPPRPSASSSSPPRWSAFCGSTRRPPSP